ncbi:UNVERIFIED_CONTAM: hypothetical protein O8I53_06270 [Campylobacter lari]
MKYKNLVEFKNLVDNNSSLLSTYFNDLKDQEITQLIYYFYNDELCNFIKTCLRYNNICIIDYEDILYSFFKNIPKICHKFNPNENVKLLTYIKVSLKNFINSELRF